MNRLVILFLFVSLYCNAQHTIYNTKIENPRNIIITNKIDSQIIYNTQNGSTNKIYVLGIDNLGYHTDIKNKGTAQSITKMVFGNPDSLEMRDINITIKFSNPFDTAFFVDLLPKGKMPNLFDPKSPIRDSFEKIDTAKKFINFKAGYIKAGHKITLLIFSYPDTSKRSLIGIEGAGRLW